MDTKIFDCGIKFYIVGLSFIQVLKSICMGNETADLILNISVILK